MIGFPAANREIPPPLALYWKLLAITFSMISAEEAPPTLMPPPLPPLQPSCTLLTMVLPRISGDENEAEIPNPSQARLLAMMLPVIVGDEFLIQMPPPSPKPGVSKPDLPFSTVNPLSTEERPSPEMNLTTESARFPSMSVISGPLSLVTVMALPEKFMFST